jgi:hypothetical protein
MNAGIYMVQGMEIIVIDSPDRGSTRAIELSLTGLVEGWGIKDGANLIEYLTQRVYSKNKFKPMRIKQTGHNKAYFEIGSGGFPMPLRDHMQAIVLRELGHNMFLIEQVLMNEQYCWLPLYEMHSSLKQKEIPDWLEKNFIFKHGKLSPFQCLKMAADDYYTLPADALALFEQISIRFAWHQRNLGIYLDIRRSE